MNERDHASWHETAAQARAAHLKTLRECGQLGDEFRVACHIAPGDSLSVHRHGPKATRSTLATVTITQHGEPSTVALSPLNARRLAAALADIADEIDPWVAPANADECAGEEL